MYPSPFPNDYILESLQLNPENDVTETNPSDSTSEQPQKLKTKCYKILYKSPNGKIAGYLILPDEVGPFPCVIFNRGGAKEYAKITDQFALGLLSKYASNGYVVIASQYAGNDGGEGKDEFGGCDLDDVLVLKEVFSQIPNADASRIGMLGLSRGGMMTYLSMKSVDWIKAAVTIGGMANLERDYQNRPNLLDFRSDMYDVHSQTENRKRSALDWAEQMCADTPLLSIHGDQDESVSVLDSIELASKLQSLGRVCDLKIITGADHALSKHKTERDHLILKWFKKYLQYS